MNITEIIPYNRLHEYSQKGWELVKVSETEVIVGLAEWTPNPRFRENSKDYYGGAIPHPRIDRDDYFSPARDNAGQESHVKTVRHVLQKTLMCVVRKSADNRVAELSADVDKALNDKHIAESTLQAMTKERDQLKSDVDKIAEKARTDQAELLALAIFDAKRAQEALAVATAELAALKGKIIADKKAMHEMSDAAARSANLVLD